MGNCKVDWVERYLKEVQDTLVCPAKEKKRFMVDFRENVYSCFVDEPNMSEEKLRERFGSPEEIGSSFVGDDDPSVLRKTFVSTKVRKFLLIALVVLVTLAVILISVQVHDNYMYNHGQIIPEGPFEGTPPPDESAVIIY